jgi:hypothetical protein
MQTEWPTPDQMLMLAKENPDVLETILEREIESLINSAPKDMHHRLRGLQFQINAKRRLCKTPMAACIQISLMMFDSFHELNDTLSGRIAKPTQSEQNKTARVLRFPDVARS